MPRFVPVTTTFGQTVRSPRFVPVSGGGGHPSAGPGAVDLALPAVSNAARLGRTGLSLVDRATREPGEGPSALFREGGAALGTLGGLADIALSATDDRRSDFQRGTGIARGGVQVARSLAGSPTIASAAPGVASAVNSGLNAGVSIGTNVGGGAANVPYVNAALAGLNIADIAGSNLPDERKAFEAAGEVGATVADAFLPVIGGMAARVIHRTLSTAIFDSIVEGGDYAATRKREASRLPGVVKASLRAMSLATTPEELRAAAQIPSGKVGVTLRPDDTVSVQGTHLELGPVEQALTESFRRQLALIEQAKTNPALAAELARRREAHAWATSTFQAAGIDGADPYHIVAAPDYIISQIDTRLQDWRTASARAPEHAAAATQEAVKLEMAAAILGYDDEMRQQRAEDNARKAGFLSADAAQAYAQADWGNQQRQNMP